MIWSNKIINSPTFSDKRISSQVLTIKVLTDGLLFVNKNCPLIAFDNRRIISPVFSIKSV